VEVSSATCDPGHPIRLLRWMHFILMILCMLNQRFAWRLRMTVETFKDVERPKDDWETREK